VITEEHNIEVHTKLNINLPYDLAIPLLSVCPKELKAEAPKGVVHQYS
jgi:hypothetical protein